jgi:hypothetical protein
LEGFIAHKLSDGQFCWKVGNIVEVIGLSSSVRLGRLASYGIIQAVPKLSDPLLKFKP